MKKPRILIVEDEAIVAMDIRSRLGLLDYDIAGVATSGETAVALAETHQPDLVLMDIRLQGDMDGIAAAVQIRERCHLPVVFLTAYAEDATLQRAKLAEPFGYVLKPFEDRELKTVIEMALFKHQAEREIHHLNRLLAMLSQVNQAIIRVGSRDELFAAICRIAVEHGKFKVAWIGWLDPATRVPRCAARWGEEAFVHRLADSPEDPDADWMLSGPVHRDGRTWVCSNLASDDQMIPWQKAASDAGIRAVTIVPICCHGKVCGTLGVGAAEADFFQTKEVNLLEEVASDITFALGNLERNTQRQRAEESARAAERDWQNTFDAISDAVCIIDTEGRILRANRAVTRFVSDANREIIGHRCCEVVHMTPHPPAECPFLRMKQSRRREVMILRKGDQWFEVMVDPMLGEDGQVIGAVHIAADITERKRVSEELLAEKRFSDGVINSLPGLFYVLDEAGRMIKWNSNLEALSGYSSAEISGMSALQFVSRETTEAAVRAIREVFDRGESQVEATLLRKAGEGMPCLFTGKRLQIPGGPRLLAGMAIDISQRKRAEEALRESETRLRAIVERAPFGAHSYELQADGRLQLIAANKSADRILRIEHAALIGRTIEEAFPGLAATDIPASYRRLAVAEGVLEDDQVVYDQAQIKGAFAIHAFHTGPNRMTVFFRDITEPKRAEEALRDSEAKYRRLHETMMDAYCRVDMTGRIEETNLAFQRLVGYTAEELRQLTYRDLTPENWRALDAGIIEEQILKRDYSEVYEKEYRRKDGTVLPVELRAFLLRDAGGQPAARWAIVRDISERKRAEMALLREREFNEKLLESLPGIFFLYDSTCHLKRWNKAHETAMGFSADELRDWYIPDWHETPEEAAVGMALVKSVIETGVGGAFETTLINKEGRFVPYLISITRLLTPEGPFMMGVGIDITDRRRTEEALRRSEALLRATLESIEDGVLVVAADGHLSHFNARFLEIWSIPPELAGSADDQALVAHVAPQLSNPDQFAAQIREIYGSDGRIRDMLEFKNGRIVERFSSPIERSGAGLERMWVFRDVTARVCAETALRDREARLSSILRAAPVGIGVAVNRVVREVNAGLCQIAGYRREELIDQSTRMLYATDEDFAIASDVYAQLTGQSTATVETRWRRKDGAIINIVLSAAPFDPQDPAQGVTFIVLDITERKEASERVRRLVNEQRIILNTASAGIAFLRSRKLEWINPAFTAMFGYEPQEVQGQDSSVFYAHPEDYQSIGREGHAQLARGLIYRTEIEFKKKDGTLFWCELSGQAVNAQDLSEGAIWVLQDITERKRAEVELQKLAAIVMHSSELVNLATPDGKMVFLNEAGSKMLGIAADEVAGTQVLQVFPDHLLEKARNEILPLMGRSASWEGDLQYRNLKTGALTDVRANVFTITDPKTGIPLYLANVSLDITERKRAEEALRQSAEQHRIITNTAMEGYAVVGLEGRLLEVNDAYCRMLGYSRDELLAKSVLDLEAAEAPDQVEARIRKIVAAGSDRFESRHRRKDGGIIDVEVSITYMAQSGQLLTFLRDITERKRAEATLQKNAQETEWLMKSMANAFVMWETILDPEGKLTDIRFAYFNDAYERVSGVKLDEVRGRTVREVWPQTEESWFQVYGEVALSGKPKAFEMYHGPTHGLYACNAYRPWDSSDRICVVFEDITERRQAEEALKASERNYREVVNATNDAIFVHDRETGDILDVNEAMLQMFRYTREEALRSKVSDISSGVPPYSQQEALGWVRKAGAEGLQVFEWLSRRKDGELFWVEVALKAAVIGGKDRILAVARDITERKRAGELVRLNAERVQVLLKLNQMTGSTLRQITEYALEEGVRLTQSQIGYLAFLNEDETVLTMHSWSKQAMQECAIIDKPLIYPVKDTGLWGEAVRRRRAVITNDYAAPNPLKKGHPAGHVAVQRHMNVPVFVGQHMVLVAGVGNKKEDYNENDVQQLTLLMEGMWRLIERLQAEEAIRRLNAELEQRVIERTAQLQAANKELEAFSYSVSHDLRAPLRAINGFARILLEDYTSVLDAEGRGACDTICNNARRMGQLIDDLLAFSRLGRAEMKIAQVDMEGMARLAFEETTTGEERKRIRFRLDPLPSVSGDASLLRQVWVNLLSNAVKFSSKREQASIEVTGRQEADECVYSVRDNGAGFDMQYATKLFGVFQRLHTEQEFKGTGVGLAIVQRVIHRHGGRVWAEAQVEQGATFYFALPQKGPSG